MPNAQCPMPNAQCPRLRRDLAALNEAFGEPSESQPAGRSLSTWLLSTWGGVPGAARAAVRGSTWDGLPRAARAAVAAAGDAAADAADEDLGWYQEEDADDRGAGVISVVVAAIVALVLTTFAASVLVVPLALPAGRGGRVVRWEAGGRCDGRRA
eukprot:scaffold45950_cov41-Phaeocystis_antarctica.AAC.3